MVYYFVKRSGNWYGRRMASVANSVKDVGRYIFEGEVVIMAGSLEQFCNQMNVLETDITMWK